MTDPFHITLESDSSREDMDLLHHRLGEFNESIAGVSHAQPLNLLVRDETGALIGGLLDYTYWGWLAVDIFWLRADLRGQGLGARLLKMAEAEALRRGSTQAHLDTLDFQALGFYQKFGYTVFGKLDDLPPGHTRYYLRKTLT